MASAGFPGGAEAISIAIAMAVLATAGTRMLWRDDRTTLEREISRLRQALLDQTRAIEEANKQLAEVDKERCAAATANRQLLEHDTLTGLPNRSFLLKHLEGRLIAAERVNELGARLSPLAVMMLDLDRFKAVNDTLGHPAGDTLLKMAATRLTKALPANALAARMGGDEFAVVLNGAANPDDAATVAERIVGAFRSTFALDTGHEVNTQISVGVAIYPENGADAETLLQHADLALYEAKSFGRGRYSVFSRELQQSTLARRALERDLALAIEQEQFSLRFQPRFSLVDRTISAIEVLLRWEHPDRGELRPAEFIQTAETTGQIDSLNFWCMMKACKLAKAWEREGHPVVVAVNLSPAQFRQPGIARRILGVLTATELPPELLELEITESVCTRTVNGLIERELQRIKGMGVRLAIDDFGTGYSSLAYLKWLPFDTIKIDQSFVGAMNVDPRDEAVVKTVVTMAKSLGKTVVAEGVESDRQLDMLIAHGCDGAQGYLLGRPMEHDQVTELLTRHRRCGGVSAA